MPARSLAHLSDAVLLRALSSLIVREHATVAEVLAHIAEVDTRRLFLPAGYSSMHAYCVEALGLSSDAASKRIQAARAAQEFPVLLEAVADGRLTLTGVCLVSPHITAENADELLLAVARQSKAEIRCVLARFPLRNAPWLNLNRAPETEHAPAHVQPPAPQHLVMLNIAVHPSTRDVLRYAQALLSHSISMREPGKVIDRALRLLVANMEKQKFAATSKPCASRGAKSSESRTGRRSIPAHIRRAVWKRDQGRCTFIGDTGHRCNSRNFLQFDHVEPVARGGQTTVDGLRLRCRAHNQLEAERLFGAGFMQNKRDEARRRKASGE